MSILLDLGFAGVKSVTIDDGCQSCGLPSRCPAKWRENSGGTALQTPRRRRWRFARVTLDDGKTLVESKLRTV